MKKRIRQKPRKTARDHAAIIINGDSENRARLVEVLRANLPRAIAAGQREIVASLISGISAAFPVQATISNSSFNVGGSK